MNKTKQRLLTKITLGVLVVFILTTSALLVVAISDRISQQQAVEYAQARVAGSTEYVGFDNDESVYEVQVNQAGTVYEVEVDATTGEVLEVEEEYNQGDVSRVEALVANSQGSQVSQSEAERIAKDETGGSVNEVEREHEFGRDVWEVEIRKNGKEADVIIDIQTGEVLAVEGEDGDDD